MESVYRRKKIVLGCLLIFLSQFCGAQALTPVDTFHYEVKLLPERDRTELQVTLRFHSKVDSFVLLGLRRDYYGTPAIYDYIRDLKADNGTVVEASGAKGEFRVKANGAGVAQLSYRMSYDPEKVLDATYAPNTSANHFHAAFCQWMLSLKDQNIAATYHVSIAAPPPGWTLYSSEAFDKREFFVTGSFRQLFSQVVGGSRNAFRKVMVKGRPLRIFLSGDYALPKEKILQSIEQIFRGQRQWFNDYDFPFFVVTVMPREDNVAGIRINNMFLCHIKKDVTLQQLQNLVSHEMFHVWLGGKVSIERKEEYPHRTHWFTEGYNDYFAKRLLLELKLISKAQYVAEFNTLLYLLDENPFTSYTYDQLKAAADSGRYGTAATKLQYYRGALMALNKDVQLKKEGRDLRTIIRQLHLLAQQRQFASIPEDEFYEKMKGAGAGLKPDFERFIMRGEKIRPAPDAMGKDYALKTVPVSKFDLGFTVGKGQVVEKVPADGPAYAAGIRAGMEYVVSENANPFSNAWDRQQPVKITLRDAGKERVFSYFPKGAIKEIEQYVAVKGKSK
jgi:predicted metalloprotease with PDZ domain